MTLDQQKEQFSRAWVHAIAATAGFRLYRADPDIDSDDIGFSDAKLKVRPRLEAQLKATETIQSGDEEIPYPLPVKNYNELVGDDFVVPRILIVLRVPRANANWIESRTEEMLLRHTAWWLSLRNHPHSSNSTSVTVHIPRLQVFTPQELRKLMAEIAEGRKP